MPFLDYKPYEKDTYERFNNVGIQIPCSRQSAWLIYSEYKKLFDRTFLCSIQNIPWGHSGVIPGSFPVIERPITNFTPIPTYNVVYEPEELEFLPGHFWSPFIHQNRIYTDCIIHKGEIKWFTQILAKVNDDDGSVEYYTPCEVRVPVLTHINAFIRKFMAEYTGQLSIKTINGRIIDIDFHWKSEFIPFYYDGILDTVVMMFLNNDYSGMKFLPETKGILVPIYGISSIPQQDDIIFTPDNGHIIGYLKGESIDDLQNLQAKRKQIINSITKNNNVIHLDSRRQ